MKKIAAVTAALLVLCGAAPRCAAQYAAPSPGYGAALRPSSELDQLLGPIALYPDVLIGLILPAATQPDEVTAAAQYLSQGGDPSQADSQPWDPGVQGLVHYPQVLQWMAANIDWTAQVGQAFAVQQQDVMDSIQRLRGEAQALGNLRSTPQETVVMDDGMIDIDPVDPNELYVPVYQPDYIYTQPGYFCTFGLGFPIGLWLGYDWDWHHHRLIAWDRLHPRPTDWWRMPPRERFQHLPSRNITYWRPENRGRQVVVAGGDRGYDTHGGQHPASHVVIAGRSNHVPAPRTEAPPVREEPHPAQRAVSSEGAFGGGHSAGEVRQASSRGGASRAAAGSGSPSVTRSAPPPRESAPPPHESAPVHSEPSGGGGGGGHKR